MPTDTASASAGSTTSVRFCTIRSYRMPPSGRPNPLPSPSAPTAAVANAMDDPMPVIMTDASAITAPPAPMTTLRQMQNSQNDGSRTVREPGRLTPTASRFGLSAAICGGGSWMKLTATSASASAKAAMATNARRQPSDE